MLDTSSCVFIPVDDPQKDLLEGIAEAVYNAGGMKNNRAGSSLAAQEPIRLPVISTKEFKYTKGVWSKVIILSVPELTDTFPERQMEVEDMAARVFSAGDKCVKYNLSFAQVWNDWDTKKLEYQNLARRAIPDEMRILSRTERNLSFLLPFVSKMIEEEQYDTTMDKVLDFAAASFERLLPKIEIGEGHSSSPPKVVGSLSPIGGSPHSSAPSFPPSVERLLAFLKKEHQVKVWIRQLGKPVNGVGNKPLAVRCSATTMANATDFCHDLAQLGLTTIRRKSIRFLHEESDHGHFKLGARGLVTEGKVRVLI